jgi:eukaryotic-like serine/threonine-protein kinase
MINSGDTISRYRIIGPLGKGGMGEVYHAEDERLQRPVALKFLSPELLTDQTRSRFLNEAQAAAVIRHPNICPIYDVEEVNGQIFISMAYLEGETLQRRIARGPMPIRKVIDIAIQIASGLEKAHELGIVHRDIKSNNIIVNAEGHAYILDFGVALRTGATRLTQAGVAVGTVFCMAPEQVKGLSLDARTDIWALGVVMYEMLTGKHPFEGDGQASMVYAIISGEPAPLSALRPDTPPELQRIIETALAKDPDRRWRRARDLGDRLRRLQESMPVSQEADLDVAATQTVMIETPLVAPGKRKRVFLAGAVLAAIAAIAAVAGVAYYRKPPSPQPDVSPELAVKQVAVLPFQVIGSGEKERAVADGLVEILTAALSGFEKSGGKFMVVPSSEIRRRGILSVEEARRVYGVNLAITGSAQPLGGKLQFTVSLVDTRKVRNLGVGTFEYDSSDPVQSGKKAVDLLARMLQVDRPSEPRNAAIAGDSAAPGAYAVYLEGRGLLARYDVQGNLQQAIARFQRATELDARYALAWSGLAEAYWRQSRALAAKDMARKAVECGERAVQLEPGLAVVHATLGAIYGTAGREEDAIRELTTATELAPSSAEPPRELARIYANTGRLQEAEALYLQATKARPTDWYGHYMLGAFYFLHEQYDKAEKVLRIALSLAPDNELVSRRLGAVYLNQGRYRDAIEELQTSLKIKSNAGTYLTLGGAYFYQHRFKEAVAAVETAIDLEPTRYFYWGDLGIYDKWAPGEAAKSVPALKKALEMAGRQLDVTPKDYDIRADLAEYRARLGDTKGALAEIAQIPDAEQQARASRLALAFELTGNRAKAIQLIRTKLANPASLTQIKDDPDLAALWKDPQFQAAIPAARR